MTACTRNDLRRAIIGARLGNADVFDFTIEHQLVDREERAAQPTPDERPEARERNKEGKR